ncbi:MAG: YqaE/Pmp3 family membrane protein [Fimbriimonadaceae bacterium]|nr:YqaE/Pmp3 family membrane protein [Fimbriimonadaceae bacterium]QYK58663.1 MAG: YqaE/Pmp3 family membrane protein [Fimbriimonadaceae bacterium]
MSAIRVLACLILPPLAVLDKGFKAILLTAVLTFLGWIPGVVAALVYSSKPVKA